MLKLTYVYLSLEPICEKSGIKKTANIENIKKAISNFDWNKAFENLSVEERVEFLNKILLIFSEIPFQIKKINVTIGNLLKKYLKERCKLTKF